MLFTIGLSILTLRLFPQRIAEVGVRVRESWVDADGLAEGDSVIAHELGHIMEIAIGGTNGEGDADAWAERWGYPDVLVR
jgi:hypothetical protein